MLTDLQLLTALCSEQDDSDLYTEFVKRFYEDLQKECTAICRGRKLDLHIGKQIANEVFEKLRRYKSFRTDKVKAASAHKSILVYLFKIASNLFADWHNKQKREREQYVGRSYFDDIAESLQTPENVDILRWKKETSQKIFGKLNSKEKQVILADVEYKKMQCYLPDEITEMLADKLGVKKPTIRKIRERGLCKIKNAIDEINQQ